MKTKVLLLLLILFAGLWTSHASAAARNWKGAGAGGGGTLFEDVNNWVEGVVPAPGDDVTMDLINILDFTTVTVSNSIIGLRSLKINYRSTVLANFTLTINSGVTITLTDSLVLKNDAFFFTFSSQLQFIVSSNAVFSCQNLRSFTENTALFAGTLTNYIVNRGTFTVNGTTTAVTKANGGTYFSVENNAITTFTGNVTLDDNSSSNGFLYLAGTMLPSAAHSSGNYVFYGNLTLGFRASSNTASLPTNFIFDGTGTQSLANNSNNTIYFANFQVGGSSNSPTVNLTGKKIQLLATALSANLTVNNNSTLDLGTDTLNRSAAGGSFLLNGTSTLKLAGVGGGQNTSNFPLNFSTQTLNSTSTVEYNAPAPAASTQRIYNVPTYGNLILSRLSGASTANKISLGALTIAGNITINSGATFNTGTGFSTTVGGNWTNNGSYSATTSTTTFNGATNATISGTSATAFYNFVMNKGTSTATTLDVNGTGLVTVTVNTTTTTITNGLLRINSGATFRKAPAGGTPTGSLQINSTAGVHVNGGTFDVSPAASGGVNNDGFFRITSGNSTIGNSSGNALATSSAASFDQQGGTLNIAGRFEVTGGTVSITGGTMNVCTIGNAASSTGSFHLSLSTNLTMSGSPSIIFQRSSTAVTSPIDLNILNSTGTKTITGGTFQFGNASTAAANIFRSYSDNIPVYNVTLFGTNNPAALMTSNLTVNNVLSLNGTGGFGINGNTLTLNGTVAGTGTITGSSTSNLVVINGATSVGTLYFTSGSQLLNNFTLDRPSAVGATLGSSLTIGNVTSLTNNGAFVINGNTLTLNGTITGTATLTGSATSNLAAGGTGALGTLYFTTGGQTLNNFTLNRTSAGSATLGTNVTIGGIATLTNGEFIINGNTLALNGTVAGTSSGTITGSSTSNLSIGGTSNGSLGTLYFTNGGRQLNTISIDRKDASFTIGRAILGTDLRSSNITLTYGAIATGNNLFSWDHTGSLTTPVAGYTANSTTFTNSFIATCDDTGTPISVADALTPFAGTKGFRIENVGGGQTYFPVGASYSAAGSGLRPAPNRMMLQPSYPAQQDYTVVVNYGDLGNTPAPRVNRIWYVKASTDTGSVTMKLFFTKRSNTGFLSSQNELEDGYVYSDTRLLQKDFLGDPNFLNASNAVDLVDFTSNTIGTEIFAQYTIGVSPSYNGQTNGITYFNRFGAGNYGAIILPVTITGFKATPQGKHVILEWTVLNESNMDRYEVERSANALDFSPVAKATAINSGNEHSYAVTDAFPKNGSNYYRVKSIDKNGRVNYTQIVVVNFSEGATVTVYPNPVQDRKVNLLLNNIPQGRYELVIYNNAGQKIARQLIQYTGGSLTEHIMLPAGARAGVYTLSLFNDAYQVTRRIVVAN